jgi:GNAT superfamily N-acetyltransferase
MRVVNIEIRKACRADQSAIEQLIVRSARTLGLCDYSSEQIEAALRGAFGVDTQLIDDSTYFVAEVGRAIVGCGGWSRRRTLFGSDSYGGRDASKLNPAVDAAKIRAFFVDPAHARRGIGRALLARCEAEARAEGFTNFELMSTLTGVKLYRALGYEQSPMVHRLVSTDVMIEFVPMHKASVT